ncbi:MAG: hypothetical protein AB1941_15510 [Gemmatimonadota bacterium]
MRTRRTRRASARPTCPPAGHVRDGVVARESTQHERIPRRRVFLEDVSENTAGG